MLSFYLGTGKKFYTLDPRTSFPCPKTLDLNNAESLQELCLSLLETLNDRMLQLKHQRKANKHILERLSDLESKIMAKNKEMGEIILRYINFLKYAPILASFHLFSSFSHSIFSNTN